MAASSLKASLTRKAGPLPVWTWAVLLVVGFYLHARHKASGASGSSQAAAATGNPPATGIYVPGFDAASLSSGSAYSTPSPSTVTNNYYYGTEASGQASGGGTSSGLPPAPDPGPVVRPVDPPHNPPPAPAPDPGLIGSPPGGGGRAHPGKPIAY